MDICIARPLDIFVHQLALVSQFINLGMCRFGTSPESRQCRIDFGLIFAYFFIHVFVIRGSLPTPCWFGGCFTWFYPSQRVLALVMCLSLSNATCSLFFWSSTAGWLPLGQLPPLRWCTRLVHSSVLCARRFSLTPPLPIRNLWVNRVRVGLRVQLSVLFPFDPPVTPSSSFSVEFAGNGWGGLKFTGPPALAPSVLPILEFLSDIYVLKKKKNWPWARTDQLINTLRGFVFQMEKKNFQSSGGNDQKKLFLSWTVQNSLFVN